MKFKAPVNRGFLGFRGSFLLHPKLHVAQIFNLPYRRISSCRAPSIANHHRLIRTRCRLQICDTAEYNSALRLRVNLDPIPFGFRLSDHLRISFFGFRISQHMLQDFLVGAAKGEWLELAGGQPPAHAGSPASPGNHHCAEHIQFNAITGDRMANGQ